MSSGQVVGQPHGQTTRPTTTSVNKTGNNIISRSNSLRHCIADADSVSLSSPLSSYGTIAIHERWYRGNIDVIRAFASLNRGRSGMRDAQEGLLRRTAKSKRFTAGFELRSSQLPVEYFTNFKLHKPLSRAMARSQALSLVSPSL